MIADIQRELDALPTEVRAKTRERIIRMLHESIATYDPDFKIVALVAESNYIGDRVETFGPSKAYTELIAVTAQLDKLDPEFAVREAIVTLRMLIADARNDKSFVS